MAFKLFHVALRLVFLTCWWRWEASLTIKIMVLVSFLFAGMIIALGVAILRSVDSSDLRVANLTRDLLAPLKREAKELEYYLDAMDKMISDRAESTTVFNLELFYATACIGTAYLISRYLINLIPFNFS